jgi:cytochrome P450
MLALDFMPAVTAPKGHKARLAIAPAFEEYYNAGLEKNASGFVQGRARAARNWGFTTEEISKAEVTIISASVTNTVPNVFFMVCNIFANSKLVSSLREEIHKIVTRISREGTDKLSLDISMIENHCPLLISCYYESMRLNKTGASTRMALSDVMLNDQYLLKKGSIIQIATGVLQSDVNTWGADAKEFNGWRFIAKDTLLKEAKKSQTQAWIPFGGGRNLCPGRHLAFTEITAFVAMMVYGFELTMNDGSVLSVPKARHQKLGVGSKSPKHDLEVVIRRRGEFEGSTWVFNAHTMEP